MNDKSQQQLKADALEMLSRILPQQADELKRIDQRLYDYYVGLQDGNLHNLYEILGGLKFLRVLRTYPFSHRKVRHAIRLYEGEWKDGEYLEGSGGLMFSGLRGYTHYQLQPFQVFALAGLLGPQNNVDGDWRRLCTELVLFLTRKSGKTLIAAFINFLGFFFFDSNYEGYCTANSAEQAKILYRTSQHLIRQMDPSERRIRFTASQTNWKVGQPRQASFTALSAGGKTKDGLFAQAVFADEFGSADFTNGKSDMLDLVSVVQSSMGPRREPLTVITTTAGFAPNGPFNNQKRLMEDRLEDELTLADDHCEPQPDDFRHALLLQPDRWEQQEEEVLLTDERIWRKANPMIGVSVQPSFYQQEAYKARQNPDQRKEFITKLVNVYENARVSAWTVTGDKVRALQTNMRFTDCRAEYGWKIFPGMDFSAGGDMYATSYFCVNYSPGLEMKDRFFADTVAWISEKEMQKSPNRTLYEQWVHDGWLKVCPGEIMNPELPMNEMMESMFDTNPVTGRPDENRPRLNYHSFGYDPAQSRQPINTLKAWLQNVLSKTRTDLTQQSINELIKAMIIPVSQGFLTMNPIIGELEHYILTPWMKFSESPLWPWMAGNVAVAYSRDDTLRRLQKQTAHTKIDCYHALLDAIYIFDLSEGKTE